MAVLIWFYIISVVLFYLMLIIDGKNYGVGFKNIFQFYGFNIVFMFIPLINLIIFLLLVYVKIIHFFKK